MEFFDKKEEVIDLQLTQYGKYLLSQGKFRPVEYAFFDNDIIYDSRYAGPKENNTLIENRIFTTPRPKVQYMFTGRDSKKSGSISQLLTKANPVIFDFIREQNTEEKHYSLGMPMGTMEYNSNARPAWSVVALHGEIGSVLKQHTGSLGVSNIPQLEMEIEYETKIAEFETTQWAHPGGADVEIGSVYEDMSFVDVNKDLLILQVEEHNAPFSIENFDIEVYVVEEQDNIEKLTPLYFSKTASPIVDNILLDENEMEQPVMEFNNAYANYFINLWVDDEIDPELVDVGYHAVTDIISEKIPEHAKFPAVTSQLPKPTTQQPVGNIYDDAGVPPNDEEPCD